MNGLNGKPTEYPENALVPYPVILAASKGDPDAMKIVLQHFSGYIASLSELFSLRHVFRRCIIPSFPQKHFRSLPPKPESPRMPLCLLPLQCWQP